MFKQYFEYRDGELYYKAKTSPSSSINVGDKVGGKANDGYSRVQLFGKKYLVHRVIWEMFNGEIPKGKVIDHINNNSSDNRIENLQCITQTQNAQRIRTDKGYQFDGRNKLRPYMAQRGHNYIHYHLGYFGTACGAYMANRMFFIGSV